MNLITEALHIAINSLEYDGEDDKAKALRVLLSEVGEDEE